MNRVLGHGKAHTYNGNDTGVVNDGDSSGHMCFSFYAVKHCCI